MRWPLLVIILLSLTACGQKGDLYLPEKSAGDKPAQNKTALAMRSAEQSTLIFY